MEEYVKRYHQNFLLCSNNEVIADLFNSFCEEWLHFSR